MRARGRASDWLGSPATGCVRPVPARERHAFLWDMAAQLRDLPEGAGVEFRVE